MRLYSVLAVLGMAAMAALTPAAVFGMERPPCPFLENVGQWDVGTKFVAAWGGGTARIERNALALDLPRGPDDSAGRVGLRFSFEGSSPGAVVVGEGRSSAATNLLIGKDPSRWYRGVPSYHRVAYRNLYPGVDVRVRNDAGGLKYDVRVAPGAELAAVTISCSGVTALRLAADGSLEMETAEGMLLQPVPATWQELPYGGRMAAVCRYRILEGARYGFEVPDRDVGLPLVIDPSFELLHWSTFLGTAGTDGALTTAFGSDGQVIAAGITDSGAFPVTPAAYDTTSNGGWDAWVACFDPTLSGSEQLIWCTYLGGGGDDFPFDVAFDATDGSILVVGSTTSSNFPTPNGYDQSYGGGSGDGFAARLSQDGSNLICATYLGSPGTDWAVKVDASGSGVTLSGYTNSSSFPTTPEAYDPSHNGGYDVFITRLNPPLSDLVFSTFLGGGSDEVVPNSFPAYPDRSIGGLAVSAVGASIVSGRTQSIDFPVTPGAYQTGLAGLSDAFVAQISSDGSALEFSTYYGGSGKDGGWNLAIRPSGEIAVCGYTPSGDLPITPGAFDTSFNGGTGFIDGFIACFDPAGSQQEQLRYATYLGGSADDQLAAIASDALGDLIVGGCAGQDFPVTEDAYDPTYNGGNGDAFMVRLRPTGMGAYDLIYGTFLGGSDRDMAWSLALPAVASVDAPVVLAGSTRSTDFPTTPEAFCVVHNGPGGADGWVALLGSVGPADVEPPPVLGGAADSPRLGPPHPNPADGPFTFTFELPVSARVRVDIYDAAGRVVADLLDRELASGRHELTWDPETLRRHLAPGAYFIRLDAAGRVESQKLVIGP